MKHSIAAVLDNCIDDMRRGRTEDECLAAHPDMATELAPLLRAVSALRTAPKVSAPATAVQTGKARFLQQAAELRVAREKSARPWQRLSLVASAWPFSFGLSRPRPWAFAPALSLLVVIVLVLSTATTAVAASRSLPDEWLFPVKLVEERVQLSLSFDPAARADLSLSFAENRVEEVSILSSLGRPITAPIIERMVTNSSMALANIAQLEDEAMRLRLHRYLSLLDRQQAALDRLRGSATQAAEDTIAAALADAREKQDRAVSAIADPAVIRDSPPRTSRAPAVVPADSPTPLPTPDSQRMKTPAPPPTATARPVPPTPTAAGDERPLPTNTAIPPTKTLPPTVTPSASVTAVPTATATLTPLPRIQFSGVVSRISETAWIIDGVSLVVTSRTVIDGIGAASPGARADVLAERQADQSLLALHITITALPPASARPFEFRGIIQSISAAAWVVSGQVIAIDDETIISGTPRVGHIAEVKAVRKDGTTWTALAVTVKVPGDELHLEGRIERIAPTAWVVAGRTVSILAGVTTVSGSPQVGSNASVAALRWDDGSLIALRIVVLPSAQEEEFEGVISSLADTIWVVGGRTVIKGPATQLDESKAKAQVGRTAWVKGVPQADRSILATAIRILAPSGSDHGASPTATAIPSPTAIASPTVPGAPTPSLSPTAAPTPKPFPTRRTTPIPGKGR